MRWVFIVSDTLAWTRICKNKLYLQILQSHRDHHVVPLGCKGHASVHHRSPCISAVRPTIESARLPSRLPPRMLGGLGGMTHARESSLSSLASCSRPSSPPSYPHRLGPRVGQPIPERPRSPPTVAPSPADYQPIPERPQVEHPARARPSLPIPDPRARAVSRRRRLVSVHEVRGARARAARTSSHPPSPLSCGPFRRGPHSQDEH